jgi:predicted phage-related endonuclease
MTSLETIRTNRNEGLGGSDAAKIVAGDWQELWELKTGRREPEDLSKIFRVQLGIYTEQFHIDWLNSEHGYNIKAGTHRSYHVKHRHIYCHLDGWDSELECPAEVKHSNGFANTREKAAYYMPQLQHTMAVTEADKIIFSVIAGNNDPDPVVVDRNQLYIDQLIDLENSFWWHVTEDSAPEVDPASVAREALGGTANKIRIDGLIPYDMEGNNEWASLAVDYGDNEEAAATFNKAKAAIKKLVPNDASQCTGHGLTVKRDKRGALRFS